MGQETLTGDQQPSDSGTTRRGEPDVSYTVLFVHEGELDSKESWEPLGTIVVPARTQRKTVEQRLFDGQTVDGEGGDVPQIPLDAGERGGVILVPTAELGETVVVVARPRVQFEVVARGGVTT
jgi:hypothetical protein